MNFGNRKRDTFRQDPAPLPDTGAKMSGGAVLLCALACVCVAVLCVLAMSRAEASMKLSRAAANAAQAYYGACLEANLDIAAARERGADTAIDNVYAMDGRQELHVSADIGADGSWEIHEWKTYAVGSWDPDTGLGVAE